MTAPPVDRSFLLRGGVCQGVRRRTFPNLLGHWELWQKSSSPGAWRRTLCGGNDHQGAAKLSKLLPCRCLILSNSPRVVNSYGAHFIPIGGTKKKFWIDLA